MPHAHVYDAIVLRTIDVGEADRFCVLFTRELGKVSVRAAAARKPKSALGAAMLPLRHIRVMLKEWHSGYIVQGAESLPDVGMSHANIAWFSDAQQGIELLMRLTEDGEPMPEVFHAVLQFLTVCGDPDIPMPLAFSIRLLELLGLLPDRSHVHDVYGFEPADDAFLQMARAGQFGNLEPPAKSVRIQRFIDSLCSDHLLSPLKAPGVAASLG